MTPHEFIFRADLTRFWRLVFEQCDLPPIVVPLTKLVQPVGS